MRLHLAHEHPHPGWPGWQVELFGELGDPRPSCTVSWASYASVHTCSEMRRSRFGLMSGGVNPTEYDNRCAVRHSMKAWVAPAPSVRMSTLRPGRPRASARAAAAPRRAPQ
ncbi:hypothetical protein CAE01nite_20540 [Cellulomonas aerilata]|uniref:Uncharacterized protein n=1 Tax=Cellulomonas aerilata TaxID=515326 RepID=A0A512DCX8_9CELL|nr:hypothetical protein CAE01nite_20540 [Cellulomonas aerilata]